MSACHGCHVSPTSHKALCFCSTFAPLVPHRYFAVATFLHLLFDFLKNMPNANTNRSPRRLEPIAARNRDLATEPAHPPRDRTTELESENRRIKDTIRSLQHEKINMGRELQEYKMLSEIRGRELIGAQVFLKKADLLTVSDVKDKVNALNGENFQASASLGESLVHVKYELAKEEWEAAFAEVCRTVSEPLARALVKEAQKPEPEVNPLLVQVVLEMYLVHFCSSMIESWFPGNRETSDFLTTIYNEIRRAGEFIVVHYGLPLIFFQRNNLSPVDGGH